MWKKSEERSDYSDNVVYSLISFIPPAGLGIGSPLNGLSGLRVLDSRGDIGAKACCSENTSSSTHSGPENDDSEIRQRISIERSAWLTRPPMITWNLDDHRVIRTGRALPSGPPTWRGGCCRDCHLTCDQATRALRQHWRPPCDVPTVATKFCGLVMVPVAFIGIRWIGQRRTEIHQFVFLLFFRRKQFERIRALQDAHIPPQRKRRRRASSRAIRIL